MSSSAKACVVIPVKCFSKAKLRLAPVLTAGERAELAQTMLTDVLGALSRCRHIISEIAVVTSDSAAAEMARSAGATVVADEPECGINRAVARAIDYFGRHGSNGLVVVPSDIPQISRATIDEATNAIAKSPSVAIAEAVDDGGTNLFACRPAGIIPSSFGRGSFNQHRQAALQARAVLHVLNTPEIAVDIDRPADLLSFARLGSCTRSHDFLVRLNVLDRVGSFTRSRQSRAVAGL